MSKKLNSHRLAVRIRFSTNDSDYYNDQRMTAILAPLKHNEMNRTNHEWWQATIIIERKITQMSMTAIVTEACG